MTRSSPIADAIRAANRRGRAAVLPYFMLGFPTLPDSVACVQAAMAAGADVIEVGIPFSDPLADGPVIQHASQIALDGGATPEACLRAISDLTGPGRPPIVLMTYFNLLLSRGLARTLARVRGAGVSGLIIPDLSFEAAAAYRRVLDDAGMDHILLLAPTSAPERIRATARRSRGFVYLVSVTGVTGARRGTPADLAPFVARVRRHAGATPLCVGFGISGPREAKAAAAVADGVIVGSALVEILRRTRGIHARARATRRFVSGLMRACRRPAGAQGSGRR